MRGRERDDVEVKSLSILTELLSHLSCILSHCRCHSNTGAGPMCSEPEQERIIDGFRGGEAALVTTSVLRTQDRKEGKHTQEKLPQHPSSAVFPSAPASKNALVYFSFSLSNLKINVSNIL